METVSVQDLIDAGVHFGCRVSRWNPNMAPYIHGRRNQIHVIDLRQTMRGLLRAQNFLYHLVAEGSQILWVGTKRQVKGVIQEAGQRTGMPIVTERWIGGTLTNFSVIRSRLHRLEELESMDEDGSIHQYSKKVVASLRRELRKISRNLSGIREMNGIPGAMIVVDPGREVNAVREAKKLGMAVIGLLDTDCDPEGIDVVIPGNDDALRSVRLLIEALVRSVEGGAAAHRERMASTGVAERAAEPLPEGEPRPTRAQNLPGREQAGTSPASADESAGSEAAAETEEETAEGKEPREGPAGSAGEVRPRGQAEEDSALAGGERARGSSGKR